MSSNREKCIIVGHIRPFLPLYIRSLDKDDKEGYDRFDELLEYYCQVDSINITVKRFDRAYKSQFSSSKLIRIKMNCNFMLYVNS